ncbi:unnamed protein product, partial [Mesorhabditis belari]|uniref:Dienelactone hydrolase domain-containing protein n=1 Tax=Mesorhabditis belari TaxID=2138241 RepID=A0AAF3F009_9BILA
MVKTEAFEYSDSNGDQFEGLLAYPEDIERSERPGVIVFHAFGGCGKFEREKALELAKLGYVALAADVYGKGKIGTTTEENFTLLRALLPQRTTTLKRRILATFEAFTKVPTVDTNKIAATGYCFGGLCGLDLARFGANVKGIVSFHGTLLPLPEAENTPIHASIQIHHADLDHRINEQIAGFQEEMRARKADWHFVTYSDAEHGFTEPEIGLLNHPGVSYNEKADKRSWSSMKNFFEEMFA